jgi:hypothetical protein
MLGQIEPWGPFGPLPPAPGPESLLWQLVQSSTLSLVQPL